jgi:hypothetical protein
MNSYFIWSKHGETQPRIESIIDEREEENLKVPDHAYCQHYDGGEDDVGQDDEGLHVEELMHNVALDVLLQCRNKGFNNLETLDKASRDLLYEKCKGCHKEHTVLWMTLELLKLKASNGWSYCSFSALLELLCKVLPNPNDLPTSTYLAKKIICPLTSYTKKNTNSKRSVQGAMLVRTNGMTIVRKITAIIRGKDGRGIMLLLQIKTFNGLKREKFLPTRKTEQKGLPSSR